MKHIKTYKYQLRPSQKQTVKFLQILGVCRMIYNLCLEYKKMMWSDYGLSIGKTQLQKEVKEIAYEYEWIKDVHSQVRQNAIHRLLKTYDNFFKQGAGFPKFAKRDFYNSFTFPQGIKLNGNYIRLPKIGWVRFYHHRALPQDAKIKTATIQKEADGWHISLTFETTQQIHFSKSDSQAVGIDLGVAKYYTTSEGEFTNNPSYLKQFGKKIRRLNRKLARQTKGSNRRNKTKLILQKTYQKLRRKRQDFIHKLTFNIVKEHSTIVVEDLNLKNMTKSAKGNTEKHGKNVKQKSGLNRVLLDLSAGEFIRQLEYKSKWYGREFVKVNPAYTSQECNACGFTAKENRKSQSKFKCVACGHNDNADINAAKNILRKGLSVCRKRSPLGQALAEKPTL